MTEHERLLEEFEDARFALLMEGVARKEGERLEALNEMLQENPEAAVPESVDKRCLEAIDRHFSRERRRAGLRKTGRVLRLAAVVMAISVVLFTSVFAFSEDLRLGTMNLILKATEHYTQFSIRSSLENNRETSSKHSAASFEHFGQAVSGGNQTYTEFFRCAEIGWIPEGFRNSEMHLDEYVRFENEREEFVLIQMLMGCENLEANAQGLKRAEKISINGNEGFCAASPGEVKIMFADVKNDLYIEVTTSGGHSVEVAKKVAENITIKEGIGLSPIRPDPSGQYFQHAKIKWIPEGFDYSEGEYNQYARFESAAGEFFVVSIYPRTGNLPVEAEYADGAEKIRVNGNEGFCAVRPEKVEVMTADLKNQVYIEVSASAGVAADTVKQIVESISIGNSGQAAPGGGPAGSEYFQNAEIGWLPDGFTCIESMPDMQVKFEDEQGERFLISIIPGTAKVHLDTENPENLEHITINGNKGLCIVKYQEVEIMLADLEHNLYIEVSTTSGISLETAKKMAENITIL